MSNVDNVQSPIWPTAHFKSLGSDQGLPGKIAEQLIEEIVDGRIRPGQRLNEVELAEAFGTSRTPVREALRLLAAESFVELIPRRGARVTELTHEEAADVYLCRAYLFGLAAKLTAVNRTEAQKESFHVLQENLEASASSSVASDYLASLRIFNDALVEVSGSRTIKELLVPLHGKSLHLRYESVNLPRRVDKSLLDYQKIVRAIDDRDGAAAERAMRQSIAASGAALLHHVFRVDSEINEHFSPERYI